MARILVTGATGYVGGRLIPRLLELGHEVRVLVRDKNRISDRLWFNRVEVMEGNLCALTRSLYKVCDGIDIAYYLVHSLYAGKQFALLDQQAALNFTEIAQGKVRHVIYLGGLLPHIGDMSEHLRSRAETGKILRSKLPVTEFRAGPIIGSGSASFEMIRYLTERLPVMLAPKWISNTVHPIAIRDVLSYLLQAIDHEPLGIVEIGGDSLSFKEMMLIYAKIQGYRRIILPLPVLLPKIAALWVGLVTPVSNKLAVPLIEGIISSMEIDSAQAEHFFPNIYPISYRQAVELALAKTIENAIETHWSGARGFNPSYQLKDWEGVIRETRMVQIQAPHESVFNIISSLGGKEGWLVWNWLWRLRGFLDKLVGGPGLRRGRRHPKKLLVGEAVDFWRVEAISPPHFLRLQAEMKLPGKGWLQWEISPPPSSNNDDKTTNSKVAKSSQLIQTSIFQPHGFCGFLYWYILYPIHYFIFTQFAYRIKKKAEKQSTS